MSRIDEYTASFIQPPHAVLRAILVEEERRNDVQPSVGAQVGRVLALLVQATRAQRVLELGTSLGYSTLQLALALRETGGRLTSVEIRPDLAAATRANLEAAGVADRVDLIVGDAREALAAAEGPFDLILQDSDKSLYPELLELCVQKTRLHGIIAADDTLFPVLEGIPERMVRPIEAYNQLVFADPRLLSTLLPIGDGLMLSLKVASD